MSNPKNDQPNLSENLLRKITLFENFSDKEISDLYQLGEQSDFRAKANIIVEGEQSRGLFIVLEGNVSIFKHSYSEKSLIRLALFKVGASFGELSLFDRADRSATVAAETDCSLFHLEAEKFNEYLNKNGNDIKARFYKKCAEDLAARFREQNSDYLNSQQLLWQYALKKEKD